MNTRWLVGIIVIILIIVLGWYLFMTPTGTGENATSTATSTQMGTTSGQTQSDGTITFAVPADFGMATDPQQILVSAYIPPCNSDFSYCLYYNGTAYQDTNFEAAGLRIAKRADISGEQSCLNTAPEGFDASTTPSQTANADAYSTSVFPDVGDAGAGHTAAGKLYRLYVKSNSSCYEFETRIGNTQYGNYPTGTIQEFTTADRAALQNELNAILKSVTLGTTAVAFPGI
ncbi:MAG TPA: hypothetical protein VHD38_00025 [Candidatus Paceibacterota bacterium]|nr:hypothetical protein [Candidatus Paceibacterota bacterium]